MIRKALPHEAATLTEISFAAKKYWKYPPEYYVIWRDELTISPEYINAHEVYVYDTSERIKGFYSLVELTETVCINSITLPAGLWLEHMFLLPEIIGRGIGTKLFNHCVSLSRTKKFSRLRILVDPNSLSFYVKMGCRYIKEFPSTIEGRTTPYLEYFLKS